MPTPLEETIDLSTCSLAATGQTQYDPESNSIRHNGAGNCLAVAGEHFINRPGTHDLSFSLTIRPNHTGQNTVVKIDVANGGLALASTFVNFSGVYSLTVRNDSAFVVRYTIHSEQTAFDLLCLHVRSYDNDTTGEDRTRLHFKRKLLDTISAKIDEDEEKRRVFTTAARLGMVSMLPLSRVFDEKQLFAKAGLDPTLTTKLFSGLSLDGSDKEWRPDLTRGHPVVGNAFQLEAIRDGKLQIRSPIDSAIVASTSSIPIAMEGKLAALVYDFLPEQTLLIGTGLGWAGVVGFVWFPDQDILVFNDAYWSDWISVASILDTYLHLCLEHDNRIRDYRAAKKNTALMTGYINILGHYFWNDVTGLERVVRHDLHGHVDAVVCRPVQPWLEPRQLFDEFDGKAFDVDFDDLLDYVLDENLFLVRPTGTEIDEALADRIRRKALACFQQSGTRYSAFVDHQHIDNYLLVLNLRAHNKSWLEQVDGLSLVIEKFFSLHGDKLSVYIDGKPDCRDIMNAIDEKCRHLGIRMIDGTDCRMEETLSWMGACDFFVAVVGSGLSLLTWLADKPGVCYGDKGHLSQIDFWGKVRHLKSKVVWTPAEIVQDVGNIFYSNYHISPAKFIQFIEGAFSDEELSRQPHPQ